MGTYIRGRLLRAIPVVLGVSTLVFFMIHLLPGDPAQEIASRSPGMTQETVQKIRVQLGLDKPLYKQYFSFLGRVAHGKLGRSIFTNQQVSKMIRDQVGATLQLTFAGIFVAILLGVTLGIVAAVRHNTWVD